MSRLRRIPLIVSPYREDLRRTWVIPKPESIRRYSPEDARRWVHRRDYQRSRMAVTYVGNYEGTQGSGSTTCTITHTASSGNLLVAIAYHQETTGDPTTTLSSISGTVSGSYTVYNSASVVFSGSNKIYIDLGYATAGSGSDTITATFNHNTDSVLALYELTAGVPDQKTSNTGNSSTPNTTDIATSVSGCFAINAVIINNTFGFANWWTAGNSFTLGTQDHFGGAFSFADEYLALSSTGTAHGSSSFVPIYGTTGAGPWANILTTFKPSGGAASPLFQNQGELNGMGVGGPFFRNPIG